jgi:hypothetical protein
MERNMDPIDKLNRPSHKQIDRISFFFEGGSAQDYNLEPEDTFEETDTQVKITYRRGQVTDTIEKSKIVYRRKQTMVVKIRYADAE